MRHAHVAGGQWRALPSSKIDHFSSLTGGKSHGERARVNPRGKTVRASDHIPIDLHLLQGGGAVPHAAPAPMGKGAVGGPREPVPPPRATTSTKSAGRPEVGGAHG